MLNLKKLTTSKLLATSLLSVSFIGLLATSTPADDSPAEPTGTILPSSYTTEGGVATPIHLDRTVTLNLESLVETITETTTGAPEKLDVLFLADNTGSMGGAISNVQSNASSLLATLSETYDDIQFGVALYNGDPTEYGDPGQTDTGDFIGSTTETRTRIDVIGTEEVPETRTRMVTGVVGTETYTRTWYKLMRRHGETKYRVIVTNEAGEEIRRRIRWRTNDNLHGHTVTWTEEITGEVEETYEVMVTRDVYGEVEYEVTVDVYEEIPRETQAYTLLEPVDGGTVDDAIAAIDQWTASGGGDWKEGGFFALHQAATSGGTTDSGYSTGFDTYWRDDSDMKMIVMFGDAKSHTHSIDQAETIQALNNNGITVVAINADTITGTYRESYHGMDPSDDGIDGAGQASTIAAQTGGQYSSVYSSAVASTMTDLIGTAAVVTTTTTTYTDPKISIGFRTSPDPSMPSGLTVTYECMPDPSYCVNVGNGDILTVKMTVIGDKAAEYSFDTEVFDVNNPSNAITDADNLIILHTID